MNSLALRTPWLGALFTVAAAWSPVIAAAQDCTDDADCGAGYRCQTDSYESCGGTITCTPDGECTELPGDCETVTYAWCTNATCTDDAECPSHMACQAQTTWQCDGGGAGSGSAGAGGAAGSSPPAADAGACAPGEMCPTEEPSCVEVPADSLCIPRYQLPCTVASDCGGGFDCIQSSYWECDGGMGTDADGGVSTAGTGAVAPLAGAGGSAGSGTDVDADGGVSLPPDECHEVPSTDYYCQLQDLPCSADSECPDGLKCLDQYIWTCTGGGAAGSGTAGAGTAGSGASGGAPAPGDVAMDADAGSPDGTECTTEVQQRCMPPEYAGGGGAGSGGMSGGGSADAGADDDAPGDPGSGSAGAGGAGGAGGAAGGGGDDESDDDHDHGHHFGWLKLGCSAGGPIGGDPLGWIALGMVTLVLRRRARRG